MEIADETVQIFGGYGYIVEQVIDLYGAMGKDGRDEIAESLLGNPSR